MCVCVGVTALHKALSSDGVPLSTVLQGQTFPATLLLRTEYRQLAVVVDISCAEGVTFVTQVRYCLRSASDVVRDGSTDRWLHVRVPRSGGKQTVMLAAFLGNVGSDQMY